MDAQTIDQEYAKLQTEFQDVAKTVQGLAEKMQAAEKAGDTNATDWLSDLKLIAQDISDEQTQANTLLQAIHGWVNDLAQAQSAAEADAKPPLYAVGHEPEKQPQPAAAAGHQQGRQACRRHDGRRHDGRRHEGRALWRLSRRAVSARR